MDVDVRTTKVFWHYGRMGCKERSHLPEFLTGLMAKRVDQHIFGRIAAVKKILLAVCCWLLMVGVAHAQEFGSNFKTVTVNGVTRAIEYLDSAGYAGRVVIFHDSAVTDYGDASTIGSISWAINQLPPFSYTANLYGGQVIVSGSSAPYMIGTSIPLVGGLRLSGSATAGTVLKMSPGANCDMFTYNSNLGAAYFTTIENMEFQGDAASQTSGGWLRDGSDSGFLSDFHVNHVFIYNFHDDALTLYDGWGVVMEDVVIEYGLARGVVVRNPDFLKLFHCKIQQNAQAALDITGGYVATITGNSFGIADSTGNYPAVHLAGAYILFNNNHVMTGTAANSVGVDLANDDNMLQGNFFYGSIGVQVENGVQRYQITGNNFEYVTTPINDLEASSGNDHGLISNNWGFNPGSWWSTGYWTSSSPCSLTHEMSGLTLSGLHPASPVQFDLPSLATTGDVYTIVKSQSQNVVIQAPAGVTVAGGASGGAYADNTPTDAAKAYVSLKALDPTTWVVVGQAGTWVNQ